MRKLTGFLLTAELPSASLEAWEAGRADETGSAAPKAQPEPVPAAPKSSPAASLAAVAASAAALALIGWLRNRKH